jgi:uncharacterized membrane protein YhhN
MTQVAWVALAIAIGVAAVDWFAVAHANLRLRWVSKPGTILVLVVAALALHPASDAQRNAFVVALLLSLAGDVALLIGDRGFIPGLVAFLAAHLAFCVGFVLGGVSRGLLIYASIAVAIVSLAVGGRIIRSLFQSGNGGLSLPVAAYLLALAAMVALAAGSGRPGALAGAALSYGSDGLIAWDRFVRPLPWAPLPVIITYHVGQALLVLSLAS